MPLNGTGIDEELHLAAFKTSLFKITGK